MDLEAMKASRAFGMGYNLAWGVNILAQFINGILQRESSV